MNVHHTKIVLVSSQVLVVLQSETPSTGTARVLQVQMLIQDTNRGVILLATLAFHLDLASANRDLSLLQKDWVRMWPTEMSPDAPVAFKTFDIVLHSNILIVDHVTIPLDRVPQNAFRVACVDMNGRTRRSAPMSSPCKTTAATILALVAVQNTQNVHAVLLTLPPDSQTLAHSVILNISMLSCEITLALHCPLLQPTMDASDVLDLDTSMVTPQQQARVYWSYAQSISLFELFTQRYVLSLHHLTGTLEVYQAQYNPCPLHSIAYVESMLRCVCHSKYTPGFDMMGIKCSRGGTCISPLLHDRNTSKCRTGCYLSLRKPPPPPGKSLILCVCFVLWTTTGNTASASRALPFLAHFQ